MIYLSLMMCCSSRSAGLGLNPVSSGGPDGMGGRLQRDSLAMIPEAIELDELETGQRTGMSTAWCDAAQDLSIDRFAFLCC
jgi:hypothetical protein